MRKTSKTSKTVNTRWCVITIIVFMFIAWALHQVITEQAPLTQQLFKRYIGSESPASSYTAWHVGGRGPFLQQITQREMLFSLANVTVSDKCRYERGSGLIHGWKLNHVQLCNSELPFPAKINSSIDCYVNPNIKYWENNSKQQFHWQACQVRNSEIKWKDNWYQLRLSCNADMQRYLRSDYLDVNYKLLFAKDLVDNVQSYECTHWNPGTVYFLRRWDTWNYYHGMEDFLTTYLLFSILDIDPIRDDVKILVTDNHPSKWDDLRPEMWLRLFSNYPRYDKLYHKSPYNDTYQIEDEFNENTTSECYQRSIHSMFAAVSILTYQGFDHSLHDSSCRSSIITAFGQYLLTQLTQSKQDSFQIVKRKLRQTEVISFHIVFIARSNERYETKRVLLNEEAMIQFIEQNVLTDVNKKPESSTEYQAAGTKSVRWRFQRIVLENLNMSQQIEITSNADILLGVHGAGLTHIISMPSKEDGWSHLVELFCDERYSSQDTHYRFISDWKGIGYSELSLGYKCQFSEANLQRLKEILTQSIHDIVQYRFGQFQRILDIRTQN